ncbi:MAG: SpoIIE family protein phosphatase [bacterium]
MLIVLTFLGTCLWAVFAKTLWILYCQYAAFSLMLLPLSYLYTTHRFRLLEYHPVIRRSRLYSAVSLLTNFLFVAMLVWGVIFLPKMEVNYPGIWFTERSIEIGFLNDLPLEKREHWKVKAIIVATILFVIILWRVRGLLLEFIARKFYQEKYDYKKALAEFSGIVACCWDTKQLSNQVVQKLSNLMHLKNIGITLVRNGELVPTGAQGFENEKWEKVRFPTNSSWLKKLAREGTPHSIDHVTPKEKAILKNLGASFLAPISLNGRLLGLLVLGEKLSEDHYRVDDIELLGAATCQTAVALENANLYKSLQDQERLKHEMQLAQKIQLGSLPKKVPDIPGLEIFATSKPASEVGGDYYDFFKYKDHQFMTVVGDVSGKGTSAALYVAKIQGIMRSIYEYHHSPAELFSRLNELLCEEMEKTFFITQVGAKFDLRKKVAILARAGHEPVLYYNSKKDTVQFIECHGLGLGLASPNEFKTQLEEITVPCHSGDYFVLFSDGITDSRNKQDEEFGEHRLLETLEKTGHASAEQIGTGIINRVEEFTKGGRRFDDMTVCVVKLV